MIKVFLVGSLIGVVLAASIGLFLWIVLGGKIEKATSHDQSEEEGGA